MSETHSWKEQAGVLEEIFNIQRETFKYLKNSKILKNWTEISLSILGASTCAGSLPIAKLQIETKTSLITGGH